MPPDFSSLFYLLIIFFPFIFSFVKTIHIFTAEVWSDLWYFTGLMLSFFVSLLLKKSISYIIPGETKIRLDMTVNKLGKYVVDSRKACHIFEQRFFPHLGVFSLYMVFYSFSLVYFSFGKLIFDTKNFKNKSRYLNYAILFILFSLLHIGIQVSKGCVRLSEALLGLLVGLGLGVGWYAWLGKSRWDDEIVYNTTEKSKCKKFGDKFICYGKSNELPYGKKYKTSYKSAEALNMNKGSLLVFDESNDDPETEVKEKTVVDDDSIGSSWNIVGVTVLGMLAPAIGFSVYKYYNK